MRIRPHEKLIAWQESFKLCIDAYKLIKNFPNHERFVLVQQIQKSACSIPLNIAEGNAKRTPKDKIRFIDIALGSLEELHCQMKIALHLEYISTAEFNRFDDHLNKVSYLIIRLRTSITSSNS